jgi:Flp pilus assembly protein CpaB
MRVPLSRVVRLGRPRRLHRRYIPSLSAVMFWTVTLLVAVITGRLVQRSVAATSESRWGPVQSVVVVTQGVKPGETLQPSMLSVRSVPRAFVPTKPIISMKNVVGRTIRRTLVAGSILDADIVTPNQSSALSARTGQNRRAISIPAGDGALRVQPGDRVDVLATTDATGATTVAVHDAEVLQRDERSITLAVVVNDAPMLAGALATQRITLALLGG